MSFDVHGGDIPFMEIYGSEATLSVPDPNCYGGPVRLLRRKRAGLRAASPAMTSSDPRGPNAGVGRLRHACRTQTAQVAWATQVARAAQANRYAAGASWIPLSNGARLA